MACAGYLRELIIFTLIFHIFATNHCKSIKSIDKITSYKLPNRYTSEDKRVWRYCNNNDCKIKEIIEYCYFSNKEEIFKCCSCASNNCYHSEDTMPMRC